MKRDNVVIVGAGLFGSVANLLCRRAGYHTILLDCKKEGRASPAAACLTKPSWWAKLGEKGRIGIKVLEELYSVKEIEFRTHNGAKIKLLYVSAREVCDNSPLNENVIYVSRKGEVVTRSPHKYEGRVLISAGVWSDHLADIPSITPKMGCSFLFKGEIEPSIWCYAPYKQAIAFNIQPGVIWYSDGTAVKEWQPEHHRHRALLRAEHFGLRVGSLLEERVGIRPYLGNGYYSRLSENVWVSTGGGKSGVILAAYQAKKFLEDLNNDH